MKILYAGSEALPFAASGGLGDVLGSLPPAIKEKYPDADVRVVMPLYGSISDEYRSMMKRECETTVRLAWRTQYCGILSCEYKGAKFYFIDNEYYFKRTSLYGSFDDGERFAFFGRAILDLMHRVDFFPDVLHCNDWQTASAVLYLRTLYGGDGRYRAVKTVYTIHNIEYRGVYGTEILGDVFGLGTNVRGVVEYDGDINLTKSAIVCADAVTTVSPHYAEEIKTEFYSHGLYHVLRLYGDKLSGIINGIDYDYYNPETDDALIANYSARAYSGKHECKAELQRMMGLDENPDAPIVAMISRLVKHKGVDLVERVIEEYLGDNVQFVVLGTGDYAYEEFFTNLAHRYPTKVAVSLQFNKTLSKKIYAGADMFLMPSQSEPCGLSQMIASRYGAVAIVRETGGLSDSITPYNEFTNEGNGFTFANYNAHDMLYTMRYATEVYRDKKRWTSLMRRAMKTDFSWGASAEKYMSLYEGLIV
ncbi:MAG: glycogen synthase GlgA [Firmicutes bacterium]|nr:glycogen synthase GlgA [Bacillota bacterium]